MPAGHGAAAGSAVAQRRPRTPEEEEAVVGLAVLLLARLLQLGGCLSRLGTHLLCGAVDHKV